MILRVMMTICFLFTALGVGQDVRAVPLPEKPSLSIQRAPFGTTAGGTKVERYTLTNSDGMEVSIITYGGIVTSIRVPDRSGTLDDVVLGCDSVSHYEKQTAHIGGIVGRYANRIAKGSFTLAGKTYSLPVNDPPNHLHGGVRCFDRVVWSATELRSAAAVRIRLFYLSKDGEEGYPGNLSVTVTYSLTEKNELQIEYSAKTDKPTLVNLTNHSYFNLAGAGSGSVLKQELFINANQFTPINAFSIPTGQFLGVRSTPFDFTKPVAIGSRINDNDAQLLLGKGYDHNFVLNKKANELGLAARLADRASGRQMEVFTTEPGIQLYTGNWLDSTIIGKGNKRYGKHNAICLETEHFPDSPNQPNFPSTVLVPNQTYSSKTVLKFSNKGSSSYSFR
jgi:aldose 1-epimerase